MVDLSGRIYKDHDSKAWRDGFDDFRPERMLDGGFQKVPQTLGSP